MRENVTLIPARRRAGNRIAIAEERPKLRVAAYCRVSTDSDEQAGSYEVQVQHYTDYIQRNKEWELAGIYTDDGISGTNTKKREGFMGMIEDCMAGKIDMVITKSISRFARNTIDCLKYVFLPEDIDQVAAYARDIREYHYESRDKVVTPVLVLTKTTNEEPTELPNGVITVSADYLPELVDLKALGTVTPCDLNSWMDSKYEPLPTIVDAAKMFMKHEELPNIRRVNSTGIPDAIRFLKELTDNAKENQKHVLALVTGVPGAGKTFLGLQYVYDVCESNENANSVYLSGNGPLIKVLTDALNSNVFVKSIHTVVNEYIAGKAKGFNKNILVFDEGQRAWDKQQMSSKRRTDKSEPDVLVELADEELDWAVLLILVGEGQEINNGENSGLAQWNTALNRSYLNWEVVCPEKLVHIFEDDHEVIANDNLNLNTTLRSYLASDVSKFVNLIIDGDISGAKALSDSILAAGFNMYVTRDLNAAKNYCIWCCVNRNSNICT